jgi:hypothetical protein
MRMNGSLKTVGNSSGDETSMVKEGRRKWVTEEPAPLFYCE